MAGPALLLVSPQGDALERLTAWAESSGGTIRLLEPAAGNGRLRGAVEAFAAGHPSVLLVGPGPVPPAALLDLAVAELEAPMTAVFGPAPGGGLAVVGLNEIVPSLLAADERLGLAEALELAFSVGLNPVVLPEM